MKFTKITYYYSMIFVKRLALKTDFIKIFLIVFGLVADYFMALILYFVKGIVFYLLNYVKYEYKSKLFLRLSVRQVSGLD